MARTILKEIIIALLLCLAILLILAVLLYSYMPNNKVVPELIAYKIPEEAKEIIDEATEDTSRIILTYEIKSSDIKTAQKANVYNPGKVDPFKAPEKEKDGETTETGSSTASSSSNNSDKTISGEDTVNGSTRGGSGTYYTNNGSK